MSPEQFVNQVINPAAPVTLISMCLIWGSSQQNFS